MFFGAYASISVPPWNLKVIRPSAWTVAMSIMVNQSFSSKKDHRNSIRITVVFCWSRGELNSPKIIFSRWFWNIWTVSVRNGESRIHAVDGETACQRAVKRRFFRLATSWLHGAKLSEACSHGVLRLARLQSSIPKSIYLLYLL